MEPSGDYLLQERGITVARRNASGIAILREHDAASFMIPLDHEIWPSLMGGYRIPYDASVALGELERTDHPEAV
jgi:hypothetical protein